MTLRSRALALFASLCAIVACSDDPLKRAQPAPGKPTSEAPPPTTTDPQQIAFESLVDYEEDHLSKTDFKTAPIVAQTLGPDPFDIANLPGSDRFISILRGESAIVVLGPALEEIQRLAAPASATGLCVRGKTVLVSSDLDDTLARYQIQTDGTLARNGALKLPGLMPRSIATGTDEGPIYAADERLGRIVALVDPDKAGQLEAHPVGQCQGPVQIEVAGTHLITNCLLDHTLLIYALDAKGLPSGAEPIKIKHDGPFWGFSALDTDAGLLIAAGGVEDRPLDRRDGSFGHIDSFAFAYRVKAGAATRIAEVNTSEHGVITPRWLDVAAKDGRLTITATGYGGDQMATISLSEDGGSPKVEVRPAAPGIVAMTRDASGAWVAANTILDAIVRFTPEGDEVVSKIKGAEGREVEARIGEALFFTRLMAPWNTSEGRWSRFTCETCHFEGYVDGRVHFTGRGEVHASTKSLLGLGTNRPYFTRALDKSMAQMVWNEFKVANKGSGKDPWFALERKDFPWLSHIDGVPERMEPKWLRKALMRFMMVFSHRPNPAVQGRKAFNDTERVGAALFRDKCAACHGARLIADDERSLVPFEKWEALIFSERGAIVWATDAYQKTGVEPYVHDEGARPPTLRRLYKKRPYFTNGKATTLDDLLQRAAITPEGAFFHDAAPKDAARFDTDQIKALRAFIDLL